MTAKLYDHRVSFLLALPAAPARAEDLDREAEHARGLALREAHRDAEALVGARRRAARRAHLRLGPGAVGVGCGGTFLGEP